MLLLVDNKVPVVPDIAVDSSGGFSRANVSFTFEFCIVFALGQNFYNTLLI